MAPWEWGDCISDAVDAVVDTVSDAIVAAVDWVADQCFSSVEAGIRCALVAGAAVATVATGGAAGAIAGGLLFTGIQDMLDGSLDASLLDYGLSILPMGKLGGGLLKMLGAPGKKVLAIFQQGATKVKALADDPLSAVHQASKQMAKATGLKGSAKKQANLLDGNAGEVLKSPGGVELVETASGRALRTPTGRTFDVPEGWNVRKTRNGKGLYAQAPEAIGEANQIRVMDGGYFRMYNKHGQPIDPVTGRFGPRESTHPGWDYIGPLPWWGP